MGILARCYSPLKGEDLKDFRQTHGQLYAKSIAGVIHVRSDGQHIYVGRVYGHTIPSDPHAGTTWKWDVWPDVKG
jgi:hypothetical protein